MTRNVLLPQTVSAVSGSPMASALWTCSSGSDGSDWPSAQCQSPRNGTPAGWAKIPVHARLMRLGHVLPAIGQAAGVGAELRRAAQFVHHFEADLAHALVGRHPEPLGHR